MNKQNNLILELSLEEVNIILTALGERPYTQVFGLVQKIQQQAQSQIQSEQNAPPAEDSTTS